MYSDDDRLYRIIDCGAKIKEIKEEGKVDENVACLYDNASI